MAQSDEVQICFDLGINIEDLDIQISELDVSEIPDNILADVMVNFTQENTSLIENQSENKMAKQVPDVQPKKKSKKKRFAVLSPEEIDEIALNNHAPKTKKQTVWGVRVFRGK